MKMKIKLKLGKAELHDLWAALHKARSTTKTVTVDKEALDRLLQDHATLFERVDDIGDQIEEID